MLIVLLLSLAPAQDLVGPPVPPHLRTRPAPAARPARQAPARPTPSPRATGNAVLDGIAVDPDGRPLAGLVLQALAVPIAGEEPSYQWFPTRRGESGEQGMAGFMGVHLTESDETGRFTFAGVQGGRAYRIACAGLPASGFQSEEVWAPAHDLRVVMPQHRIEVELRFAGDEGPADAVPYCRRIASEPLYGSDDIRHRIDAPLRNATGTWTFDVEGGERYAVGYVDVEHGLVEREVAIAQDAWNTPTRLDVGEPLAMRRLVARVTSPEGRFRFGDNERLRFSVLSPSGQELWRSEVDGYGNPAPPSIVDTASCPVVDAPDPRVDSGTAFDVPPGRYVVRVEPYSVGWGCSMTFWTGMLYHAPVQREVTIGADDVEVVLPLPKGGLVHIHVHLPYAPSDLEPADLRWIEVYDVSPSGKERLPLFSVPGAWSREAPTGLTDVLAVGTHELVVEVVGFEPARVSAEVKAGEVSQAEVWLVPTAPR